MNELESRLIGLEKSFSFYRGAFAVTVIAILTYAGVSSFVLIPKAADEAIASTSESITKEKLNGTIAKIENIWAGKAVLSETVESVGIKSSTIGKHSLCAITKITFNYGKTGNTKHCTLT